MSASPSRIRTQRAPGAPASPSPVPRLPSATPAEPLDASRRRPNPGGRRESLKGWSASLALHTRSCSSCWPSGTSSRARTAPSPSTRGWPGLPTASPDGDTLTGGLNTPLPMPAGPAGQRRAGAHLGAADPLDLDPIEPEAIARRNKAPSAGRGPTQRQPRRGRRRRIRPGPVRRGGRAHPGRPGQGGRSPVHPDLEHRRRGPRPSRHRARRQGDLLGRPQGQPGGRAGRRQHQGVRAGEHLLAGGVGRPRLREGQGPRPARGSTSGTWCTGADSAASPGRRTGRSGSSTPARSPSTTANSRRSTSGARPTRSRSTGPGPSRPEARVTPSASGFVRAEGCLRFIHGTPTYAVQKATDPLFFASTDPADFVMIFTKVTDVVRRSRQAAFRHLAEL